MIVMNSSILMALHLLSAMVVPWTAFPAIEISQELRPVMQRSCRRGSHPPRRREQAPSSKLQNALGGTPDAAP
jgi:hypothetical protein